MQAKRGMKGTDMRSTARRGNGAQFSTRCGRLYSPSVASECTEGARTVGKKGSVKKRTEPSVHSVTEGYGVPDDLSVTSFHSSISVFSGWRTSHSNFTTPCNMKKQLQSATPSVVARRSVGKKKWNKSPSPVPQDPRVQHDCLYGDMDRITRSQPTRARDVPELEMLLQQQNQQNHPNPNMEELNSPPHLLHSQDLRREKAKPGRVQATSSLRNRMQVWVQTEKATRSHISQSVPAVVGDTDGVGLLQRTHKAAVGLSYGLDLQCHHNEGILSGDNSIPTPRNHSTPACRAAGPVVTEEWARSIVQPQDEYLLYERCTPGTTNHEKMVRCAQGVWLRDRAQRTRMQHPPYRAVTTLNSSFFSVTSSDGDAAAGAGGGGEGDSDTLGAIPVPSVQSFPTKRYPLLSTSLHDGGEGGGDAARVRALRMSERHIIARGTPLLFRRPRTQLFASDINCSNVSSHIESGATTNGSNNNGNGSGAASTGMKFNGQLQRHQCGTGVMVLSSQQRGCNKSDWSTTAISDDINTRSRSHSDEQKTNESDTSSRFSVIQKRETSVPYFNASSPMLSYSSLHVPAQPTSSARPMMLDLPNQEFAAASRCRMEMTGLKEEASVGLSLSSLFDMDTQGTAELFTDPLFVLRSEENYERLLIQQEEHEAREVLMQQWITGPQLRCLALSEGGPGGNQTKQQEKPQCTYEVFVNIPSANRTIKSKPRRAVSPPQEKRQPKPESGKEEGVKNGVAEKIVTTSIPIEEGKGKADGGETARYSILEHTMRGKIASTTKMREKKRTITNRPGSTVGKAACASTLVEREVKNGRLPDEEMFSEVEAAHTELEQPSQSLQTSNPEKQEKIMSVEPQENVFAVPPLDTHHQGTQRTPSKDAAGAAVTVSEKTPSAGVSPGHVKKKRVSSARRRSRSRSSGSLSKQSDSWIIPNSDDPSTELSDYVRFARKQVQCGRSESTSDAIEQGAGGSSVASGDLQDVGKSVLMHRNGENHCTTRDPSGDDCSDSLLLEDGGQYLQNVTSALSAFGKMWKTMFHDPACRDQLPLSVQAQLLFFESSHPKNADDGSCSVSMNAAVDGKNVQ